MTISYPEPDRATLAASLLIDHDAEDVQLLHTKAANSRRGPGLNSSGGIGAGQELAAGDGEVWVMINRDFVAAQLIAQLLETSIACGNIGIMQKLLAIPAAQEISKSAAAVLVGSGLHHKLCGLTCKAGASCQCQLLFQLRSQWSMPMQTEKGCCYRSAGADAASLVLCRDPVLGWPASSSDQGPF